MGTTWTCVRLHLCGMLVLLASCSATPRTAHEGSEGHSLDESYAHARRQGIEAGVAAMHNDLQLQGTFGYVRPHVPVRTVSFRGARYCWRILTIENSSGFFFPALPSYPSRPVPGRFITISFSP